MSLEESQTFWPGEYWGTGVVRAYSIQGSWELREEGLLDTTQWRAASNSWLGLFACPLAWARNPELRHTLAPKTVQKVFHSWQGNYRPLSETILT